MRFFAASLSEDETPLDGELMRSRDLSFLFLATCRSSPQDTQAGPGELENLRRMLEL